MSYKQILILILVFVGVYSITSFEKRNNFLRKLILHKTIIHFETNSYDFGEIEEKKEVSTYFVYKNGGDH